MTDGILTKSHAIRPPHPDQSNSFRYFLERWYADLL